MINFIVCGLEDILIRKGVREIEDDTIDMIAQLLENNVRFAVATGLNYDSVKPLFLQRGKRMFLTTNIR